MHSVTSGGGSSSGGITVVQLELFSVFNLIWFNFISILVPNFYLQYRNNFSSIFVLILVQRTRIRFLVPEMTLSFGTQKLKQH